MKKVRRLLKVGAAAHQIIEYLQLHFKPFITLIVADRRITLV